MAAIFLTGAGIYHGANVGVLVIDGDFVHNVPAEAVNVNQMLAQAGVELHQFDIVTPTLNTEVYPGLVVEIERARPVYIHIDNNGYPFRFYTRPNSTLTTILTDFSNTSHYNFLLNEPDPRRQPDANEIVNLLTIEWGPREVYVEIPYGREYVTNYRLPEGEQVLYSSGENGLARAHYNVEWISGIEHGANRTHTIILQPPVPEIVHVGADLPPNHYISASGEVFSYSRMVLMESTAYTLSESCTGRTPDHPWWGITASGMHVAVGIVAVDTNVIPFHTRMYIEGYGFAIAGDRGGAIRGYKVDVFLDTMAEVRAWGRRHNVRVWILD